MSVIKQLVESTIEQSEEIVTESTMDILTVGFALLSAGTILLPFWIVYAGIKSIGFSASERAYVELIKTYYPDFAKNHAKIHDLCEEIIRVNTKNRVDKTLIPDTHADELIHLMGMQFSGLTKVKQNLNRVYQDPRWPEFVKYVQMRKGYIGGGEDKVKIFLNKVIDSQLNMYEKGIKEANSKVYRTA